MTDRCDRQFLVTTQGGSVLDASHEEAFQEERVLADNRTALDAQPQSQVDTRLSRVRPQARDRCIPFTFERGLPVVAIPAENPPNKL